MTQTPGRTATARDDILTSDHFVHEYRNELTYIHDQKRWLVWDPVLGVWAEDQHLRHVAKAKEAATLLYSKGTTTNDDVLIAAAQRLFKRTALLAMIELSKPDLGRVTSDLDPEPLRLNVLNGVLDLAEYAESRFSLAESHPDMLMTQLAGVEYDTRALAPRWRRFLVETFGNDEDLLRFLQKAAGVSLSGSVEEQSTVVLVGPGNNGKTQFLEAIRAVLGSYGHYSGFGPFVRQSRNSSAARPDLYDVPAARFVHVSEGNNTDVLDVGLIKELTGNTAFKVRTLYAPAVEMAPRCTLWFDTNHIPRVEDTSDGTWRRMRIVKLLNTVPPERRISQFGQVLADAEGSGILNWMLEGYTMYQEEGLAVPDAVAAATHTVRTEMEWVATFLDSVALLDDTDGFAARRDLWQAYRQWCLEHGERELSERLFVPAVRAFGERSQSFTEGRRHRTRGWVGITIVKQTAPF